MVNDRGVERLRCIIYGKRVDGAMSEKRLSLQYARLLHKSLLIPTLMYGSKTILWEEREFVNKQCK